MEGEKVGEKRANCKSYKKYKAKDIILQGSV